MNYKLVDHPIKGKSVIATQPIAKDELFCVSKVVTPAPERDTRSLQVDTDRHIYIDEPGVLINHRCQWNLCVRDNEFGAHNFYATRDIQVEEELVFVRVSLTVPDAQLAEACERIRRFSQS